MNDIDFIIINRLSAPMSRTRLLIYPHRHVDLEMHMITAGHGWMEIGDEKIPVEENDFIISFPEDTHHLVIADDCPYLLQYLVSFDIPDNSDKFGQELRKHFRSGCKMTRGVELFHEVDRLWNSGSKILQEAAGHLLTAFVQEGMASDEVTTLNKYVEKAQAYMRSHIGEKLSLANLSRQVGLEPSYFCRLFKQETGETPMHFFTQLKIELAKEMLFTGRRNSDIAAATGFADEFHFSRTFKQVTGKSPRQYKSTEQ